MDRNVKFYLAFANAKVACKSIQNMQYPLAMSWGVGGGGGVVSHLDVEWVNRRTLRCSRPLFL